MASYVRTTSNPDELGSKLNLQGPWGFIDSVHKTLKKLGRDYEFTAAPPDWLIANNKTTDSPNVTFEEASSKATARDTIYHRFRIRPATVIGTHGQDNASSVRRQRQPLVFTNSYPLADPNDPPYKQKEALYQNREEIPDLIRDQIQPDIPCIIHSMQFQVYVDFILISRNHNTLAQMDDDMLFILHTAHHRSIVGDSNYAGWFTESISGPPTELINVLDKTIPTRTITWELRITQNYVFPTTMLDKVDVQVDGLDYI